MSSPQPAEIEDRIEYFESWLLDLSEEEERNSVKDNESAKNFVKEVFGKDTGLSNLLSGMDRLPSRYDLIIKGQLIQDLIKANSGEAPPKKIPPQREYKLTRTQSISQVIPKDNRAARRKIIETIFNQKVSEKTGFRYETYGKRTFYRNMKTGRFTNSGTMLKAGDKYVKTNVKIRAEVERLLKLELYKS